MASPETKELRQLSAERLARELEETHQALFNLRFQAGTRQLADVSQVRKARKRIARIKTLLTEHRLLEEAGVEPVAPQAAAAVAQDEDLPPETAAAEADGEAPAGSERPDAASGGEQDEE